MRFAMSSEPINLQTPFKDLPLALSDTILNSKTIAEALRKMPRALDGSNGAYRERVNANVIGVDTDMEAIDQWIKARAGTSHTRRLYKREAHRFLLWALYYQQRQLGDITVDDIGEFENWLAESEPGPNWPSSWRAFSGNKKLSSTSRATALNVIKGLYTYLRDTGYLNANPFAAVRTGQAEVDVQERLGGDDIHLDSAPLDRYFDQELWLWICAQLDLPHSEDNWPDFVHIVNPQADPPSAADIAERTRRSPYIIGKRQEIRHTWSSDRIERLRFIVLFGYWTAARRSELATSNMGQISRIRQGGHLYWAWMIVHGKGQRTKGKPPRIVLNEKALEVLKRYRVTRGLSPLPTERETTIPLVARLSAESRRTDKPVADSNVPMAFVRDGHLNHDLKAFFLQCADRAQQENRSADWVESLRKASAHWLRHTFGSHSAEHEIPMEFTTTRMRHKSGNTTRKYYVHLNIASQLAQLDKLENS
jgi:integrase